MTYILRLSTDQDILNTQLNVAWNPINGDYNWAQAQGGGLGIPNGAVILVIAHGNHEEIGNAIPGDVDITAEAFLALIHSNMAANAVPAAIYLATRGTGIAEFTARIRLVAQQNRIWQNVRLYHASVIEPTDPPDGPPPPFSGSSHGWNQIWPEPVDGDGPPLPG